MNYKKIYDQITEKRRNNPPEGYSENHHILPSCLGGTDRKDNMVRLTAREHFICHILLTKMYPKGSREYHKMIRAALGMKRISDGQDRYINSRLYQTIREEFSKQQSEIQSGKGNSQYGMMWICNPDIGKSIKVEKGSNISKGWIKGRNKIARNCIICGERFITSLKGRKVSCRFKCAAVIGNDNRRQRGNDLQSEETKKKISYSKIEYYKEGIIWITDGVRNTKIKKIDKIPEGWKEGRAKKRITNGVDIKYVGITSKIPKGWYKI